MMRAVAWSLGCGLGLVLPALGLASAPTGTAEDPHAAPVSRAPRAPPTLEGTASVRVRFLSARTGEPLPGVRATLNPQSGSPSKSAVSDDSGTAVFPPVRAGLFNVCARGARHAPACGELLGTVAGGSLSVDMRLPAGGTLVGTVRQSDGTPAAGVRLEVQESFVIGDSPVWVTDAQGAFRMEGLFPGRVWVKPVTPEGQAMQRTVDAVQEGVETRLDVTLAGFTPLTVHVVPDKKAPALKAASVVAGSVPLERQKDGTWRGVVEAGEQHVRLRGPRGVGASETVTLSPGMPVTLRLPLAVDAALARVDQMFESSAARPHPEPALFQVAGHVLLEDGRPVRGFRLAVEEPITGPCGNVPPTFQQVRFDGTSFVVSLPAGTRRLHAVLEDGRAGVLEVTAQEGQKVTRNITLKETGAISR